MRNISWWELYNSEDVNEAVDIFSRKISLILDKMAPIKTFQVYKKYASWLSTETKNLMLERDQAQKNAANSKLDDDWKQYKSLRNKIKNV